MLPELTKEQRLANLDKSMELRRARAEIRNQLKAGSLSASDVISRAEQGDKAAKGMRVKQFINAMPGYGFAKTQALMRELHISESRRVGGLGTNETKALIEKLDGVEA